MLVDLDGGSGWSVPWHSHGFSTPTVIANGNLTFGSLKTSGNALLTTSDGPIGNDREWSVEIGKPGMVVYASMLMRALSGNGKSSDGISPYFSWSAGDVAVGKSSSDAHICLERFGYGGGGLVPTRIVAQRDTTYFLVVRVTFGETRSLVELWVNPPPGFPLSRIPDAVRAGNFTKMNKLESGANVRCVFDEYRFGYTYADVAPIH